MKNGKKYFVFCRLLRRQISYGSYKKKDKCLNDNKTAAIYILRNNHNRLHRQMIAVTERKREIYSYIFRVRTERKKKLVMKGLMSTKKV